MPELLQVEADCSCSSEEVELLLRQRRREVGGGELRSRCSSEGGSGVRRRSVRGRHCDNY